MVTPAGVKHKRVACGNGIVTFRQPEVTPGFFKCNAVVRKSPGKPCGGAIGHTHRIKGKQPSAAAYDRTGADRAFARVGYRYGKRVFCPMLEIARGYVRPLMCAQPPFTPVVAAVIKKKEVKYAVIGKGHTVACVHAGGEAFVKCHAVKYGGVRLAVGHFGNGAFDIAVAFRVLREVKPACRPFLISKRAVFVKLGTVRVYRGGNAVARACVCSQKQRYGRKIAEQAKPECIAVERDRCGGLSSAAYDCGARSCVRGKKKHFHTLLFAILT